MNYRLTRISLNRPVSSLCWRSDELADWVGGGAAYRLDGTSSSANIYWGYKFDAAIQSPSGRYVVIYERLGTKGLLLDGLKIIREINRSYYHANVYEFPVALINGPDGRELIAHCPDEYCRIDVEDIVTGERLSHDPARSPVDFFHSRLSVSPDNRWLLSTGWVWHPWDTIAVYDLPAALNDPRMFDECKSAGLDASGEINSACFTESSAMIAASNPENEDCEVSDPACLNAGHLGVWNLDTVTIERLSRYDGIAGTLMALGADHVVSFYEHPKIIELATGKIVQRWPEIVTGLQSSSIIHHIPSLPPLALDSLNHRFAIAAVGEITVIEVC